MRSLRPTQRRSSWPIAPRIDPASMDSYLHEVTALLDAREAALRAATLKST